MIKNYIIIENQLVQMLVTCDDSIVHSLYPNKTILEAPTPQQGVRPVTPGMLYYNNTFWTGVHTGNIVNPGLSKLAFRSLFTTEELLKIDNFEFDENLPADVKAQLRTLMANLNASQYIDLTNTSVVQGLVFLETIGYITADRRNTILSGAAP